MIERYTRPEMGQVWEPAKRFEYLLQVEKVVAAVQGELGLIPVEAAAAIQKRAKFNVKKIEELEKTTRHDVIAFVSNVAENVGTHGKYVHFGLTSSDALDTALSLQVRDAGQVLLRQLEQLRKALRKQISKHKKTICVGRTHGIHAEPTTFGFKMAGFLSELNRNEVRLKTALEQASRVKLSGAVGTYSAQGTLVEKKVAQKLKLKIEDVATQVIPRDRHAEVFTALSILGAGLERLAVEVRHLQRTEVGEAEESFQKGQKGSSAMPHKRNPIASENITGIARLLRGYALSALENIALWHERDISHSSVERVIFPDGFIVAHYALHRMTEVVDGLQVYPKQMKANLDLTRGQVFSSHVLLALVQKGFSREQAYKIVQGHAHGLRSNETLKAKLLKDPKVSKKLSADEIETIFSGLSHQKAIEEVIKRV